MKRMTLLVMLLAAAMTLQAVPAVGGDRDKAMEEPVGTVTYSLPQTSISLRVEAVKEVFHAGPYAKYAKKYLGVDVKQADASNSYVTHVDVNSKVEADLSKRFSINPGKSYSQVMNLTAQGLVSVGTSVSEPAAWKFPVESKADFTSKGVTSNLTSESTTLYHNVKSGTEYNMVGVSQEMVVEKSAEARAKEAAEMIFSLRKKRIQIVTGDTDASYSGEAMGAALAEIDRIEKEYLTMFCGYSETVTQQISCEVVPQKDNKGQRYVAFRLSDAEGLVPADNISGKPYLVELAPEEVNFAEGAKKRQGEVIYYRVPATCTVRLTDGVKTVLTTRIPVYQLGVETSMPIQTK